MVAEVTSINNVFTGTNADEFANSTSSNETFDMKGGTNTINFDLSNNNHLGTDTVEVTDGEDLILNFISSNNSGNYVSGWGNQIKWEKVNNDMVINTYGFCTCAYGKCVVTASDKVDYTYDGKDYYETIATYYTYDYEKNEWTENKVVNGRYYSTTNRDYNVTYYNECYIKTNGEIYDDYFSSSNQTDYHENYANSGTMSSRLDTYNPVNTITIKNIGKEGSANSVKLQYSYLSPYGEDYNQTSTIAENLMSETYLIGKEAWQGVETEDQTLQGSFLNETFRAGYGNDTINTVGGTNTVILYNGGKDVITLGKGADTVDGRFVQSDYYEQDAITNTVAEGGVLIKNGDSADNLLLYGYASHDFYKNGNNLTVIQNWTYNGGYTRTSRFTVEDYFATESKINIKDNSDSYYDNVYTLKDASTMTATDKNSNTKDIAIKNFVEGKGTVNGTDNDDALVANTQSTITTGAGDDIIYTTNADDTITVNGAGNKTVVVDENSGNDTIVLSSLEGKVYIDLPNATGFKFYKDKDASNNDLIIERYRQAYNSSKQMYEIVFRGRTTIKDYFTFTAEQKANVFVKNLTGESGGSYINIPINKVTYTQYDVCIEGTEANDTIGVTNYNDIITPNEGNDTININNTGTKTIRLAQGDGNDTVNLSGTALSGSGDALRLSYNDGVTGNSYQINGNDLILYGTRVNGDEIVTDSVTIKGITGGTVNAENIANSDGGLNISDKIRFYKNYSEWSGWYNKYFEKEDWTANFATNTPYLTQGSTNEKNNIAATQTSNLVTGGSQNDTITANGQINHVYTEAGDDNITVTSSISSTIYAGSGNDTITVNATSTTATAAVYAHDGDDIININEGSADINFGLGSDVLNINGGTGGTINLIAGEGNKTINFNGASNAKYDFNFTGYEHTYDSTFYKKDNNFIMETKYRYSDKVDVHTVNNFFSSSDAKLNNNVFTNLDITGFYEPHYTWSLTSIDVNVLGTANGDGTTTFEGSVCEDIINGTDGVDIITLKTNSDSVTAGKGDDMITITGAGGDKHFYYSQGDGNDTITIGDDVVFGSYNYIYLSDKDYSNRPERTSYSIDGNDLVVYRTYKDAENSLTESTRIKGIKSATETPVELTVENISNSDGGLNVSGRIYASESLKYLSQMTKGKENEANNLTSVAEAQNTVVGGSKNDTITLNGSADFAYAGAGNDTVTVNATTATVYGEAGNDTIVSNAATATLYGGSGDDIITVTTGENNIFMDAGNDTVKIQGGHGTINLTQGSGNNTLIFENPNVDGVYNIDLGSGSWGMGYEKSGNDLVITRSSTTTDTLTIKELFGTNQLADGNNLTIGGSHLYSMNIAGNYDAEKKATIYSGSNYSDTVYGSETTDIITTGAGDDDIRTGKGDDTVIINGGGTKNIYNSRGDGNDTIQLADGVTLGTLRLYNYGSPNATSYQIKDNDLILYRTYVDGDKFTTESTRITGITGGEISYAAITSPDGGLNISGKINSGVSPYELTQGKTKKANKITTAADSSNLILGGNLADTITLNGSNEQVFSGAGADKITVNSTDYATVFAGGGNDTITLNGSGNYSIYTTKSSGNDTVKLGKNFSGYLTVNPFDEYTQLSYQIDKKKNLILYSTYVNGDTIKTNNTKITGITGGDVSYATIASYDGGLNISGKVNISSYNKNLVQGKTSIANKLSSKKEMNNVITGGSKNDTVTMQGNNDYAYTGAGNDTITVNTTISAYVFAGSGNDTINIKNNNYNYIYSGKGNDKINISGGSGTIEIKAGEGSDTFKFNTNDFSSYNISFSGYNTYNGTYYKSGNDLLVKNTYKNAKGKIVTETHTIKDYFKNIEVLGNKVRLNGSTSSYRLEDYGLNIVGKYDSKKKATVFTGTKFNDKIEGTSKNDLITTDMGYDKITPGKGNDTIEINGNGSKQIYINNGDGNDTIKWTDSENTTGGVYLYFDETAVISYKKSGTDLVIARTFAKGNDLKTEKTTIKGYYDAEGNVVESVANNLKLAVDTEKAFNKVTYKTNTINVANNYELAVGTAKADTITTTAENCVIFANAGNDTININNGNAFVIGGAGNDTINLNTSGTVTLCHAAGDGNDTIYFGAQAPSALRINIESEQFDNYSYHTDEYMFMSGKHGLIQSGNDLIYSIPTSSEYNTKTEKITFKDYFNEETNKPEYISTNLSDYDYHLGTIESIASRGIWVEGSTENGVTTYTGLADHTNRYEYNGTGKTVINGANRADYYTATLTSKSNLYINDAGNESGWGNDALYINTSYKKLRALFNVNSSGRLVVSAEDEYSDNLMIFNKDSFTVSNVQSIFSGNDGKGVINIDNVFAESDYYSPNGTGRIEHIYAGKDILKQVYNYESGGDKNIQELYTSYWVEDLGQDVANWLSTYSNGKYANKTAFDVFENGSKDEVAALLKVYNTAYDTTFSS